jgi:hypothetical protein
MKKEEKKKIIKAYQRNRFMSEVQRFIINHIMFFEKNERY